MENFLKTLIYTLLSFFAFLTQAQDISKNELPLFITELNAGFKPSPNGSTFGLIADISKPFYATKSGKMLWSSGLQEDFQVQLERGFEGASGTTVRNSVDLILGPTFYFLKSHQLSASFKIFGGWSYKTTNGKVDNSALNINRSYSDSYHYFSRGLYLSAGYRIKQDCFFSIFYKADLRRLTNGDGIIEMPEMIYGIGVKKIIQRH